MEKRDWQFCAKMWDGGSFADGKPGGLAGKRPRENER
jgi:hypothetical protein